VMRVSSDKRFLEFVLYDGQRFEERGARGVLNTEFIRSAFKEYKKVFDLSSFKMGKTEDSLFQYNPQMLSIRQLNFAIDSLQKKNNYYEKRSKSDMAPFLTFIRYEDSNLKVPPVKLKVKTYDQLFTDSLKRILDDRVISQLNSVKSTLNIMAAEEDAKNDSITKHWIEFHRKFALSVACIVLFMIGAPLGSIIRKGGLGTPLVFAIIFFVLFHLLNTFGEKFAKEHVASPFVGMWLACFVLFPIIIFLVSKAMRDSQLFNQEFYFRFFRNVRKFIRSKKAQAQTSN